MYVPAHFAMTDAAVHDLLADAGAADLVTHTAAGLLATTLPVLFDPAVGGRGALLAHLARNNDQWRTPPTGEALAIVRGPVAAMFSGGGGSASDGSKSSIRDIDVTTSSSSTSSRRRYACTART